MAAYIASGTTAADGADFTLTDGTAAQLALTAPAGSGRVTTQAHAKVQYKTSDGVYIELGRLNAHEPVKLLAGPGTFRVVKQASAEAFGVDKS